MKKILHVFVLVLALAVVGCAGMKPVVEDYVDVAKSKGISDTYLQNLEKWTRKSILYSEFETRAYIVATQMSPEFCQAYEKEDARLYAALPKAADAKVPEKIQMPADGDTAFYVYASAQNNDTIDFDKANSAWKIYLTDDKGKAIDPIEIRQIKKITPRIEQFYPYVSPYHGKLYLIRFQQPTAGKQKLTLVFTGVLGRVEVAWP